MRLNISNIGRINKANIEINSISLIAGDNNSGKSTISKIISGITSGLNRSDKKNLFAEKYISVVRNIDRILSVIDTNNNDIDTDFSLGLSNLRKDKLTDQSLEELEKKFKEVVNNKLDYIDKNISTSNDDTLQSLIGETKEKLEMPYFTKKIRISYINNSLKNEFYDSLVSKFESSRGQEMSIKFKEDNNDILNLSYRYDDSLNEDKSSISISRLYRSSIYIDDPYVIDDIANMRRLPYFFRRHAYSPFGIRSNAPNFYHRKQLASLLQECMYVPNFFESEFNEPIIKEIFDQVITGKISFDDDKLKYKSSLLQNDINLLNLSTGMKSFIILKTLIESGELQNAECLILDEPEVHLHPKWQVSYAELIALIAKRLHVRVLVTSHSPYFIEALDLYSKKHEVSGCKFYKSHVLENNMQNIEDVTNNLDIIYREMYEPYQQLNKIRKELDMKDSEPGADDMYGND